jgi:hypothetical protein
MSDLSVKFLFGSFVVVMSQIIIARINERQMQKMIEWDEQITNEYVEYLEEKEAERKAKEQYMMSEELIRDQRVIGNCNLN